MNRIRLFPLMASAILAATSVAAHAQYVRGGMGEEVRIGYDFGDHPDNRMPDRNGLNAAGRDKGRARAEGRHQRRAGNPHRQAPTLRGKQLP
ncbi:hypothetical protein P3W85_21135 [Cupriavidus basilensis]|uniref:Uncharacterized protein n=1 Tax=Cupriavidus basilensis TaxID=68895 RepID=A0ABT6AS43_9BURK|nr:hypothetical protein [Cupriavidus basilensis]MDF3835441.1 hypothetical protein [Cupriavidus basilensis]